jgi:hypothetical protein
MPRLYPSVSTERDVQDGRALLAGAFIPELARQRNDRRRFEAKLRHEHHLQATLLGRGYLRYPRRSYFRRCHARVSFRMIAVPVLGLILLLGPMYYVGSAWTPATIFFFGWALNGVFPLIMGTIPSETVSAGHVATALGLVMGTGEVLGGTFSPAIAGRAADLNGLSAPLWIMTGLCTLAGLLAFGLTETAPRRLVPTRMVSR